MTNSGASTAVTIEVPLTPTMRALLLRRANITRWSGYVAAVLFAGGGGWLSLAILGSDSGDLTANIFLTISVLVTALFTFLCWSYGHRAWRGARLDARDGVCLKTTGPVSVKTEQHSTPQNASYTTYELRLFDRTLRANMYVAFALEDQRWATVLYSKHNGVIFEIRDLSGNPLYRDPKY